MKVSGLVCVYILWVIASLCVFMYAQPLFHGHVMVSAPVSFLFLFQLLVCLELTFSIFPDEAVSDKLC